MAVLICIIHDERVEWYEALILVLLYFVYIGVMYFDKTIQKWARGKLTLGVPNFSAAVLEINVFHIFRLCIDLF